MAALLALFIRSLRDDMRSKALFWARAGLAVMVVFAILKTRVLQFAGASGLEFFHSLVWTNLVFVTVAGLSYFATAITEEKEEGTLGLLRMTDLNPLAILLGKSTSRLVGGALLLLVQLPFALLAVTLGGIHISQVIGSYAVLGSMLLLACNTGLLASVIARRAGGAGVWSGLLMLGWTCWMSFLAWGAFLFGAARRLPLGDEFSAWLEQSYVTCCPFGTIGSLLDITGSQFSVANSCAWLIGGSVLAFVLSLLLFNRFCGEQSDVAPGRKRFASAGVRGRRARRATGDPIAWKDFHFIHGGPLVGWIKAGVYLIGTVWLAHLFAGKRAWEEAFFWVLFSCALTVVGIESAFAASRIFRIERKDRTLSSLYILPVSLKDIVRSKRKAVILSLVPALVAMGIGALVVVPKVLGEVMRDGQVAIYGVQAVVFVIAQFYFNLSLVAWFSLRMKWGGLPVALALSWVGNAMATTLVVLIFHESSLIVLAVGVFIASIRLRKALRIRLEQAVAEE